jgi:hypothetical protein
LYITGRFFDTVGRKKMIFITYVGSGTLLAGTAVLFYYDKLTAFTQTYEKGIMWRDGKGRGRGRDRERRGGGRDKERRGGGREIISEFGPRSLELLV